jgi:hypothetical protein
MLRESLLAIGFAEYKLGLLYMPKKSISTIKKLKVIFLCCGKINKIECKKNLDKILETIKIKEEMRDMLVQQIQKQQGEVRRLNKFLGDCNKELAKYSTTFTDLGDVIDRLNTAATTAATTTTTTTTTTATISITTMPTTTTTTITTMPITIGTIITTIPMTPITPCNF